MKSDIDEHLKVVIETFDDEFLRRLKKVGKLAADKIQNNGKIVFFGNGGSAADSQHISAEFVSKLALDRRPLPALSLTTDTSALTAIGNDYGYDDLFSRQISALVNNRDMVVGISTSGNSTNVINGLISASKIGATTIAFTGNCGMRGVCADQEFKVRSEVTARIQECHIILGHLFCKEAEKKFL